MHVYSQSVCRRCCADERARPSGKRERVRSAAERARLASKRALASECANPSERAPVAEELEVVRAEADLVEQHVVVAGPRSALQARVRAQEEVELAGGAVRSRWGA